MALLVNQEDMERMLEEVRPEGETYVTQAWATIQAGMAEILALGALSNTYCYIGATEQSLVVAILGTLSIDEVRGTLTIPFEDLEEVKIRQGILPFQKIITIEGSDFKLR